MKYQPGDWVKPVRGCQATIQASPRHIGTAMQITRHEGYVLGMPYYQITNERGEIDYADECNLETLQ